MQTQIPSFDEAQPGDLVTVYDAPTDDGEIAWTTSTEWFDDIDEPIIVKRRVAKVISVETVVFHPQMELCDDCHGDEVDRWGRICETCEGGGIHPAAGEIEVLT